MDKIYKQALNFFADEICDELYDVVKSDSRIMVNNWCAFAVLAMYREVSKSIQGVHIPTIDECLDGKYTPPHLYDNSRWVKMMYWHNLHWRLSQSEEGEIQYAPYIRIVSLQLEHYTLSL